MRKPYLRYVHLVAFFSISLIVDPCFGIRYRHPTVYTEPADPAKDASEGRGDALFRAGDVRKPMAILAPERYNPSYKGLLREFLRTIIARTFLVAFYGSKSHEGVKGIYYQWKSINLSLLLDLFFANTAATRTKIQAILIPKNLIISTCRSYFI